MKINELITSFSIALTNEESHLLSKIDTPTNILDLTDRERYVAENLIRKSLLTKVNAKGDIIVVKNG